MIRRVRLCKQINADASEEKTSRWIWCVLSFRQNRWDSFNRALKLVTQKKPAVDNSSCYSVLIIEWQVQQTTAMHTVWFRGACVASVRSRCTTRWNADLSRGVQYIFVQVRRSEARGAAKTTRGNNFPPNSGASRVGCLPHYWPQLASFAHHPTCKGVALQYVAQHLDFFLVWRIHCQVFKQAVFCTKVTLALGSIFLRGTNSTSFNW